MIGFLQYTEHTQTGVYIWQQTKTVEKMHTNQCLFQQVSWSISVRQQKDVSIHASEPYKLDFQKSSFLEMSNYYNLKNYFSFNNTFIIAVVAGHSVYLQKKRGRWFFSSPKRHLSAY